MENQQCSLKTFLLEECIAMVKHLSAEGKLIPQQALPLLNRDLSDSQTLNITSEEVLQVHNSLVKLIAPSRPKTIWLLYKEQKVKNLLSFLGPVKLIRRLMLTALLSLIAFIMVSLSPEINSSNIKNGIFEDSGFPLLVVLIFYLTSASLGASFSNLFEANKYIINNTYDPKYESAYWVRFVLGVIAGILLAVIIPVPTQNELSEAFHSQMVIASRPLLAMLGGFSASLVYRILFRIVYAFESLFIGNQSDLLDKIKAESHKEHELEIRKKQMEYNGFLNDLLRKIKDSSSSEIECIIKERLSS